MEGEGAFGSKYGLERLFRLAALVDGGADAVVL
jgi:hypothetical protein